MVRIGLLIIIVAILVLSLSWTFGSLLVALFDSFFVWLGNSVPFLSFLVTNEIYRLAFASVMVFTILALILGVSVPSILRSLGITKIK